MANHSRDVFVVGAGIVGLAVAMKLLIRYPFLRVTLLEKESEIATHQTGHNSGVIHSGIYYRPGSLKATLCVLGARLLTDFADHHGIGYKRCGKLILATNPVEFSRLETLWNYGNASGIKGLALLNPEGIREIEPHASGLKAIYSRQTGVIDFKDVAKAMAEVFVKSGGRIMLGAPLTGVKFCAQGLRLETPQEEMETGYLINCGGLYADRITQMMGIRADVRIIPFRGEYFKLRKDREFLVKSLIYPVPDPELPFLGIHLTRTIHEEVKAGPNAVLALAREGYRKRDIRPKDAIETVLYPGFWKMARKYWRMGIGEFYRSASKRAFVKALGRFVPEIRQEDLEEGPSGLRAQCVDKRGELVNDFKIIEGPRSLHVINVPSPAATASLAIADMLLTSKALAFSR